MLKGETMQTDTELLMAARDGDEDAFETIAMRFTGLIWQGYKHQNIRGMPQDWIHEARIVLFQCIQRIKKVNWGVLTSYYQRALYHHPVTLWRQEEKRAANVNEAIQRNLNIQSMQVTDNPELQLNLFCQHMDGELSDTQYQLLLLRVKGYSITECSKILNKSKSWCYLTLKDIRIYCEQWTR